jgi:hypothetical protein
MTRPWLILSVVASAVLAAVPRIEAKECKCRYYEQRIEIGAVACIRGRLAQCVMFQNNPSWKFISDTCPLSRRDEKPRKLNVKTKIASG